jgi:hypothetical protein
MTTEELIKNMKEALLSSTHFEMQAIQCALAAVKYASEMNSLKTSTKTTEVVK